MKAINIELPMLNSAIKIILAGFLILGEGLGKFRATFCGAVFNQANVLDVCAQPENINPQSSMEKAANCFFCQGKISREMTSFFI